METWKDGALVGGLYGVALGSAFFGESMFSTERDASKVALVYLAARLIHGGFTLLDTQFVTDHLRQFGTVEVDRSDFHKLLEPALARSADFLALPLPRRRMRSSTSSPGLRRADTEPQRRGRRRKVSSSAGGSAPGVCCCPF